MKKTFNNYDERQLWVRGNIFQNSVIAIVVVLLIDMLVLDLYGTWAPGRYQPLLILMFIITFISTQLAWRGVYITNEAQLRFFMITMGILSLMLVIMGFVHLIFGSEPFIENGMLNTVAGNFFVGVLILPVPITCAARIIADKKQAGKDED